MNAKQASARQFIPPVPAPTNQCPSANAYDFAVWFENDNQCNVDFSPQEPRRIRCDTLAAPATTKAGAPFIAESIPASGLAREGRPIQYTIATPASFLFYSFRDFIINLLEKLPYNRA